MSVSHVRSLTTIGLDGIVLDIETDLGLGLPTFSIVGLPDKAVEEAKERVRSAFKNTHLSFPQHRLTINLAPADLKKSGSFYDLPMAVGIAIAMGFIEQSAVEDCALLGELSLGGEVRGVSGVLPAALHAREMGLRTLFVPYDNAAEAANVKEVTVIGVRQFRDIYSHLRGETVLAPATAPRVEQKRTDFGSVDMSHIRGQAQVKRALEIAAAGGHNVLMIGPPGSGKTLLAKAFCAILPTMAESEIFEVTKLYSISGLIRPEEPLVLHRPFRSPHHTSSLTSLVGGGTWPRPGEISLAHRGVLFLDELPEFPRSSLESLRQPLEDGVVTIARAAGSVRFPAKFILLATQNPCPCGYLHDPVRQCRCNLSEIRRYQHKVSGPLLDRIDLHISVPRISAEELAGVGIHGESTIDIQKRVEVARTVQLERFSGIDSSVFSNSEMKLTMIEQFGQLTSEGDAMLRQALEKLGLSARAYHRTIKVARTIADLAGAPTIEVPHIAEALQFRESIYSAM